MVFVPALIWAEETKQAGDAEARAAKYFESIKESQRRTQERDYLGLGRDVAKVLKFDEQKTKSFLAAIRPLIDASLDHWRLVYRDHFLKFPDKEDSSDFWEDLGDSVQTPAAAERRKAMAELWQGILSKELTAEQQAAWAQEVEKRRAKLDGMFDSGLKRFLEAAEKRILSGHEQELGNLLQEIGQEDARAEKLKAAPAEATKAYMEVYRTQVLSVVSAWRGSFFRASSTSMENFEKRAQMNLYIPGVSRAREAGRKAFDAHVNGLLTEADQKKIAEARKELDKRIAKAATSMVEAQLDRMNQEAGDSLAARIEKLSSSLSLSDERRKLFEQRIEEKDKTLITEWKKEVRQHNEKSIRSQLERQNRNETLKRIENGNYWFNSESADAKLGEGREELWQSLLNSLLSAEERERFMQAEKRLQERKASAFTHLVISELDQKVRLTPLQRDKLIPIVMEGAQKVSRLPGGMGELVRYYSLDYSLGLLHGVNVDRLHAVLDDLQIKRLGKLMPQYEYQWRNIKGKLEAMEKKKP